MTWYDKQVKQKKQRKTVVSNTYYFENAYEIKQEDRGGEAERDWLVEEDAWKA